MLRNAFEDLATEATQLLRYGGGKSAYAGLIDSGGDHTVITPSAGKRIRVVWVAFIPSPDADGANLVTVKFQTGGALYVGYALAHWEAFTGAPDDPVIVNTANDVPVAVTIHYEEIS